MAQLDGRAHPPAIAEPDMREDDEPAAFPILPEAVPLALLFIRAQSARRHNPYSGAPDGIDWGQVEVVARLNAVPIDPWAFDVLAEMFGHVERLELARWQERQKQTLAKKER